MGAGESAIVFDLMKLRFKYRAARRGLGLACKLKRPEHIKRSWDLMNRLRGEYARAFKWACRKFGVEGVKLPL